MYTYNIYTDIRIIYIKYSIRNISIYLLYNIYTKYMYIFI